jgi:hypothetical protein
MLSAISLVDTSNLSKHELMPLIVDAALRYVQRAGRKQYIDWLPGTIGHASIGRLDIAHRAAEVRPYWEKTHTLDIWFERRKVFSVCWNSNILKDYGMERFERGPWVPVLLVVA